jgi:hypothetical protein
MPRIKWISDEEATGETAEALEAVRQRYGGHLGDETRCFSLRPDLMKLTAELFVVGHFRPGFLNRRVKEMIATYVSALNHCQY